VDTTIASTGPVRRSPVHELLEHHVTRWVRVGDAHIAARLGGAKEEEEAARELALCDLSALAKLGVRGPDAENWLRAQGLEMPNELYETRPLPDGGILARVGTDQFMLESGVSGETVATLAARLGAGTPGAYPVERQEATFLLVGRRTREVLAQTCGIDFAETPPLRLIYTRIAGVSSAILPETVGGQTAYRLWVDPSYAPDLWHSLATIVEELGGRAVGAACVYPELSAPSA
jgi:sarcosine oxidase, subunit gamma